MLSQESEPMDMYNRIREQPFIHITFSQRGQRPLETKRWSFYFLISYLSITSISVIFAHSTSNFRCSHMPPTPEQVSHVLLGDANSSAYSKDFEFESDPISSNDNKEKETTYSSKFRRHIDLKMDTVGSSISNSGNFIRKLEHVTNPGMNDLVPIKIQVYYDNSVYLLEPQKLSLIVDVVMPSVIKFFESVLSIKREYAIDKFRISRRCPNNTLYYARDIVGLSRPYCMGRCEDYAICGEMVVPQAHLSACSYCNATSKRCLTNYSSEGKGVANTQLLLYVSAKQTARCRKDQTIAYAAHCAQDAKTDRPVAGHANLCPNSISTEPKDLKALIATVKHELTHVLGFSVSLFAYYRDEHGAPLTERDATPGPIPVDPKTSYAKWSDKIIKKVVRSDWVTGEGRVDKEVHLIVTPTVVREVRNHFNCSTLEGAELEDQGSDGTSMTHWEKRLFENEAMTGTHTQNSIYSRITLAVLQDTGWYVANFSRAESLEWGKNLGCDFAQKSCKSWIDERRANNISIRPFCDRVKGDLLQIACTEDRTSKAVCNMKQYKEPLPLAYQNFDYLDGVPKESLGRYGGSVDLADYCPFIQEFTWQTQNVTIRGSRCDLGGNNQDPEKNAALEHYGPQTKCFEHERRWDQRSCVYRRHWHHYGAGCYKYNCANDHVSVLVGNHSYPCYYPDQLIHVEQLVDHWLYNGTLICPACEKICPAHKCKSHDKVLIDKILSLSYDIQTTNILNDTLRATLDEALNSIDINRPDTLRKNLVGQKHTDMPTNRSIENEHFKIREHLLQIVERHRKQPRGALVCSASNNSILESRLGILWLPILSLVSLICQSDLWNIFDRRIGVWSVSC